ncbi:MAG: cupin domain-containing protein, partial [Clostridia bacterium]|nr:cupin domain-containing protein [Clostridia bacterium]
MNSMTGLDIKIREMAGRIRELREIEGLTVAEMAAKTDVSEQEYLQCEQGLKDLNFAFIYRCALAFNVDVTDIIGGVSPTLRSYTVTRNGMGQKIEQAHGLTYFNLAAPFMNRIADPLYVKCAYSEEAEHSEIALTTHEGQECDIVLEGQIKVQIGEHSEILGPGDSIYYDSDTPHGMIAVNGKDAAFYAIVLKPEIDDSSVNANKPLASAVRKADERLDRVYRQYT